jgi:glycosyltransferase involved in cell wall biosynthesis
MKKKAIIYLHEMGASTHVRALIDSSDFEVTQVEYFIPKLVLKAIYYRDIKLFLKQFVNLVWLVRLCFVRDRTIVIGMPPFSIFVFIARLYSRRNKVIYHTSWPHWGIGMGPKAPLVEIQYGMWRQFLSSCKGVACVTSACEDGIRNFMRTGADTPVPEFSIVFHSLHRVFSDVPARARKLDVDPKLLYVGRLSSHKGIYDIVKISQSRPNWRFTAVGESKVVGGLDIGQLTSANIVYLGKISEASKLLEIYDNSDFLLLPSRKVAGWEELFGLVVIEAMSRGCIPICTKCVGPVEILGKNFPYLLLEEEEFVIGATTLVEKIMANPENMLRLASDLRLASGEYAVDKVSIRWKKLLANP